LTDLTALAQTKNISLPTSQTENGIEAYKKLNNKSGNYFGKEYSSMMVTEHKKAIDLFEKASTDCTDPDIKAWAAATLPTLRIHLDQAMICQKECEKM
jgi:putative membrane protein